MPLRLQTSRFQQGHLRAVALCMAAFSVMVLTGCQAVTPTTTTSVLRVIDATPDSGGLDIYANNNIMTYNLGFGSITSYVPFAPATYTFKADTAGSTQTVLSTRATLTGSHQYTLLIDNVAASLQAQVLTDQSQPAPTGQIALRFIDEATRVGPVDLYVVPQGSTLLQVSALLTGINFNTNTGYMNVPNGSYTLVVLSGGTVPSMTTVPLYSGAITTFQGSARTVVLLDQQVLTMPGVQVVIADDFDSPNANS